MPQPVLDFRPLLSAYSGQMNPITVRVPTEGTYVGGQWLPGGFAEAIIRAVWMPANTELAGKYGVQFDSTGDSDREIIFLFVASPLTGVAAVNETQQVELLGSPTSGTFTLAFGGQETGDLAFNASATVVEIALEALSSIGEDNVEVTGSAGGPWTVEFSGSLAAQNVGSLTGDGSNLGGDVPEDLGVQITTTATGSAGTAELNLSPQKEGSDGTRLVINGKEYEITRLIEDYTELGGYKRYLAESIAVRG